MAVSASNRYPRWFLSVAFGKGPQASAGLRREILIMGYQKTIGVGQGSAIDNYLYGPILSTDDAANLFGYGSEIHDMVSAVIDQSSDVTIRCISYPQPAGSTNYAIDTFTATGTATAGGVLRFYVQGNLRYLDVVIDSGMTPAQQATRIYNTFLTRKDLQTSIVTVPAGSSCAFRWNHAGLRGNVQTIRWTVFGITGTTYGIARTQSGLTDSDPSNAFAAVAAVDFDFIVCPDNSTDTSVGAPAFLANINARAVDISGLRGILVCGHTGSLGAVTTFATALNAHRAAIAWCRNAEATPGRIAAQYACYILKGTDLDISANLIGGELVNWRGPVLDSDRINQTEATAALNVGVCPIETFANQTTVARVVRPITSRFQDLTGNPDYACYNITQVLVPDSIADELQTDGPKAFAGYKLMDEEDDEDEPLPGVMTPRLFDDYLYGILRARAGSAQIVRVEKAIQSGLIKSKIHPQNPDRMLVPNVPLQVINWFAQAEINITQTTRI